MRPGELLYEGKAKRVLDAGDGLVVLEFKDEVTAFNGKLHDRAPGKGELAARLSARMFELLEEHGIPTHYVCYMGGSRLLARRYSVVPLEVIVRNYAYGSLLRRMPFFKSMERLSRPIVELHLKDDERGDPLVLPEDAVEAGLLSWRELWDIRSLALRVNSVLELFWRRRGLRLVDLKIEVARDSHGFVVVDEVSGDTMRLVDSSGRHLDKEVYRRSSSVEALLEAYRELARLAGEPKRRCE
ncbi:phosphoribosylaminoimidazolesuccinocarboxamide synthase [Pyrodictium delaneyi]|uniref:Phosphoribosylaminoimidazole-succinocarboxamide synthase n=1 Tax=Pyrodictium delaneyi TaxID=1273541 RepID=A0A211YP21_9CREN|nr:phosphoribosylaminoimidazolesuccinocarboxamide synthase [Pyrodictium delaneyi]OWJ54607.1 phosphoribosylaminoimidazolesuccinocarboxamide synthase [Pyrodictium delaneyi]